MLRVRRLNLSGFRGVRKDIPLIFDGKSILLFGENGTGKSSFVDALEKLFTGQISTLDGRGMGLSSDRHGPHIRNGNNPPRIAVTFNDSASTVFTQESNLRGLPAEIRKYLDSARENLYILRRRQVLQFIDSQPRDRYALLRPFLTLSGIEAMENELRRARESAEAETQRAKQELARLVDQLWRELGVSISHQAPSEENVIDVVSQSLERVGQTRINRIQDFDVALQGLETALAPFGDLTRQTRISNTERGLQQLIEQMSSLYLDQLLTTVETLRQLEAQEAHIFYEAVLEQGIHWIQQEERTTCPLCENRINPEETVSKIRQRLEAMQQVVELRRRAQQILNQARQAVRSALESAGKTAREVVAMIKTDRGQAQEVLEKVIDTLKQASEAITADLRDLRIERILETINILREDSPIRRSMATEQERLQNVLKSLPSPEMAQRLLSTRDKIIHLKEIWIELNRIRATVSELEQQAAVAVSLHEDARIARREEVQSIFDELSSDINHIYTNLHSDESHGGIRLEVREIGQGSANLRANFYDRQDEDR